MSNKVRKGINVPHVYVILFMVMVIVTILSFIVPSGEYIRSVGENGQTFVDPDSFKYIEPVEQITLVSFFQAFYEGMIKASSVIFILLICAGPLELLDYSGAIEGGINKLVGAMRGKEALLPPALTIVFTILGMIGFQEGALPFYPLAVAMVVALGYDRVAGVGTAALGIAAGFTGGALNLFTTGISQQIIGLPLYSGLGFRMIGVAVFGGLAAAYVHFYCAKIKKDPTKSVIAAEYMEQLEKQKEPDDGSEKTQLTGMRVLCLLGLLATIVLQGYGSINLGWGMPEISAMWMMLTFFIIIVFRIGPSQACLIFAKGAQKMLPAALTLGVANAVMVLMEKAQIIDTAIHALVQGFDGKSPVIIVLILYLAIIFFNSFVTTGSGKAMILMPILAPFAQIINIPKQVVVLIFQYGDGPTNYFFPTSGVLMAGLSMCGVDYKAWAKFSWKIILLIQTAGFILLIASLKVFA
ncbi:YfcC family protein [Bacilliculturomica massiliensis]|uniref:YfcC family protein n=1 Tax=Bacilliculturomica massiliensis TaxID=1917867 RepID=UPI001031EE98|nr:YfcC family protein [Bacilliculturomica massiliensis]